MKFLGKVVVLEKPHIESKPSGIELGPEAKQQLEDNIVKKFSKLKVHGVGEMVERIKTADFVLVTPKSLSYADTFEIDNVIYYIVPENQVVAIH
jgi:co-chaperonin GroES (HSP10)